MWEQWAKENILGASKECQYKKKGDVPYLWESIYNK